MNFKHAIGFMVVGAVLGGLPSFAPGLCAPAGDIGASAGELWLRVMSTLQIGIAMTYFGRRILSSIAALLEQTPKFAEVYGDMSALPERALAPARNVAMRQPQAGSVRPLPEALHVGVLDTPRAEPA